MTGNLAAVAVIGRHKLNCSYRPSAAVAGFWKAATQGTARIRNLTDGLYVLFGQCCQ